MAKFGQKMYLLQVVCSCNEISLPIENVRMCFMSSHREVSKFSLLFIVLVISLYCLTNTLVLQIQRASRLCVVEGRLVPKGYKLWIRDSCRSLVDWI